MHDLTPSIPVFLLAGWLAACGPLPTAPASGWDKPDNVNAVTGERVQGR